MVGRCLHCLSAFTASTTGQNAKGTQHHRRPAVSIAFRHSPRPPPRAVRPEGHLRGNGCLHFLSAFTASTTSHLDRTDTMNLPCLHCLSAFTASTTPGSFFGKRTGKLVSIAFRHSPRPPPVVLNAGPLRNCLRLHCLSAFTASTTPGPESLKANSRNKVSIAFRHSPRPPLPRLHRQARHRQTVSIAFRHSPRPPPDGADDGALAMALGSPLPFGIHRVHHRRQSRNGASRSLSPLPFGIHRVHHHERTHHQATHLGVSIAFRHSPRPPQ